MKNYYMLFRNDKIYIKSNKSSKVAEYSLNNSTIYPNVPLYFVIFNNEMIIKELKMFIRENLDNCNTFMQRIFGKRVFLLIPDDVTIVTDIERRAFNELGKMLFAPKNVILGSECAFVAPFEEKDFICISRTCRMMILSYIKDKKIVKQNFIKNKDYTNEELYDAIRELYNGIESIPKIYLNGVDLIQYSDIGIVIDSLELINKFEITIDLAKLNI